MRPFSDLWVIFTISHKRYFLTNGFGRSLTVHLPNMNHSLHAVATCHECVLWGACWEPLWFWEAERYRNREAPLALLPTNPLCTTPGWHTNDGGNDLDFYSGTSYTRHKTLWMSHFHMNSYLFFSCCWFFLFVITQSKTNYSHTLFLPPIHPKSVCGACALRRRNRSLPSCSKHVSKRHIAHYDENQLDPPCFPVIGGSQQSCTWGRILDVNYP